MQKLRVFCELRLTEEQVRFLRDAVMPHEMIFAGAPAKSVFPQQLGTEDFQGAEIVFGYPRKEGVLTAPNLRWVQITTAGYTHYDTPEFRAAAAARGILLTNASDVYAEACAEHILAFMLAQARKLPAALSMDYAGGSAEWQKFRTACGLLKNQSAVILGYGMIAERLVEMLAPFAMRVTALRRRARGDEQVPVVTRDVLPSALANADHIINILPDNAESRLFVSTERIAAMKRGATFYNIGRGTTVDQDALCAALHSGGIGAAWLDVTEPEPLPPSHPLRTAPNCHITPHVAGGHQGEGETLIRHFVENFGRFTRGEPLRNRVIQ